MRSLTTIIFDKWKLQHESKNGGETPGSHIFGPINPKERQIDTEKAVIHYFEVLQEKGISLHEFLTIENLASILPAQLQYKFSLEEYDLVVWLLENVLDALEGTLTSPEDNCTVKDLLPTESRNKF